MSDIKISVIVCTCNRCDLLKETVLQLFEQNIHNNSYEIIVVDNNSTDDTKLILEEISKGRKPALQYIMENRQGLSFARNKGAMNASGKIIAYIDDDAIAEEEWLKGLLEVYERFDDAGIVGGMIKPLWLDKKPSWITRDLEKAFTVLNYGNEIKEISLPQSLFGANFSVKRSIFLEVGGFSTQLGRKGSHLISNEELYLCYRVVQNGKKLYYAPNAVVHHKILKERLNKRFLYKRAYAQGISNIIMERELQQNKNISWLNDLSNFKEMIKSLLRHLLSKNNKELLTEDLYTIFLIFGKMSKRLF